ncbi:hypothetical protein ACHAWF_000362, partial [Thalassiosira exigua]
VLDKELFARGEERVTWEVINAILYRLTEGNRERRDEYYAEQKGAGMIVTLGGRYVEFNRCEWEMKSEFLPRVIKAIKATSSKEVVKELVGVLLYAIHRQLLKYQREDDVSHFTEVLKEYIPRDTMALKIQNKSTRN